jgi:3-phenylpropionate/cinnamic acid dioxygenase small subunit
MKALTPIANTVPTDRELIDFVIAEARMLDQQRLEEWLSLFTDDAYYWMPVEPGQTDPLLTTSLMYEDMLLLKVRVARLRGARTYSEQPPSRGHRLLQVPSVDARDEAANTYITYTPFHYVETRGDAQDLYAGWSRHTLTIIDGRIRIRLKRVDLVNCDAAFGNIRLFM